MSRHGYRGDGGFGQFCVVLPEQDAVVAITAGTEAMQAVLDSLWQHLLPGLGTGRTDDATQQELDQRLAGLRLPALVAKPSPPRWQDWTGRPFPVAPGAEGAPAVPLTSVELQQTDSGLEATIAEPASALTFPVGAGDWLVSAPRDGHRDTIPVARLRWLAGRPHRPGGGHLSRVAAPYGHCLLAYGVDCRGSLAPGAPGRRQAADAAPSVVGRRRRFHPGGQTSGSYRMQYVGRPGLAGAGATEGPCGWRRRGG
jgi:hypothetical protein